MKKNKAIIFSFLLMLFLSIVSYAATVTQTNEYIYGNRVSFLTTINFSNYSFTNYSTLMNNTNFVSLNISNQNSMAFIDTFRVIITSTNSDSSAFSQSPVLSLYCSTNKTGENAKWRSTAKLAYVSSLYPSAAGDTNLFIADSTDFAINDLIYLMGVNSEYLRVLAVPTATNLLLETPIKYSHAGTNGVCRAIEANNIILINTDTQRIVSTKLLFPSNTNLNLRFDIIYRF